MYTPCHRVSSKALRISDLLAVLTFRSLPVIMSFEKSVRNLFCRLEMHYHLFYCSQDVIFCVLFIPGRETVIYILCLNAMIKSERCQPTVSIRLCRWPRWSWPCQVQAGCPRSSSSYRSPRPMVTLSLEPGEQDGTRLQSLESEREAIYLAIRTHPILIDHKVTRVLRD